MKLLCFLIVLFVVPFGAAAQAVPDTASALLKVPFLISDNKLFIEVGTGKNKQHFIFDSGAFSVGDETIVKQKGAKQIARFEATDAAGQTDILPVYQLKDIRLGNVTFKNPVLAQADISELNKISCISFAGLFGANLMKNLYWVIDFEKQIIYAYRQPVNLTASASPIPLYPEKGTSIPSVKIEVSGQYIDCVLDLGAGRGLSLNKASFLSASTAITNPLLLYERSGNKALFVRQQAANDTTNVYFVNVGFENKETVPSKIYVSNTTGNLLGIDFLKNYEVHLDFISNRMFLIKGRADSAANETRNLYFDFAGNKIIVGGATGNAELLGNEISQVNNLTVTGINKERYCEIKPLLYTPGTVIHYTNGGQDTVRIVRTDRH